MDQTNHFTNAFVRENVLYFYDVVTLENLPLISFCLEKSRVIKRIFKCFIIF